MLSKPTTDLLRALRRFVARALLAGLVIGLPLQSLSSTLAGLLGPRHGHQAAPATPSHDRSDDPMAGWRDFRRANYEHRAVAASAAPAAASGASTHRHAHETGLRHRHAPDDAGVVDLEAPADGDGAPAGSTPAGAGFALAAIAGRLEPPPRPAADGTAVWRAAVDRSFAIPLPRRIERPPSRA